MQLIYHDNLNTFLGHHDIMTYFPKFTFQVGEILKEKFDNAHEVQQKKRRGRRMLLPRFQVWAMSWSKICPKICPKISIKMILVLRLQVFYSVIFK